MSNKFKSKPMNLSKVKIVGSIPNFDRRKAYPEFGYKGDQNIVVSKTKRYESVRTK